MSDSKLKKALDDCAKALADAMAARAEVPHAMERGNKILLQCQINIKYLQRHPDDEDVRAELIKNTERLERDGPDAAIRAAERAETEYVDCVNALDKIREGR